MYVRVLSSAYSAYKNGRMVVAGGLPNVAIESAVARCQLRYCALYFTERMPLFHAKQTNTLTLSRMQKHGKKGNTIVVVEHELDMVSDRMHRVFTSDFATIAHVYSRTQWEPGTSMAAHAGW